MEKGHSEFTWCVIYLFTDFTDDRADQDGVLRKRKEKLLTAQIFIVTSLY